MKPKLVEDEIIDTMIKIKSDPKLTMQLVYIRNDSMLRLDMEITAKTGEVGTLVLGRKGDHDFTNEISVSVSDGQTISFKPES